MEAVRLRRIIMNSMSEITALAGDLQDPEERDLFLRRFAELRSRNAQHHSSWPIVAIDFVDPEYGSSIRLVREEYRRFFSFVDERYGRREC